jgi:hypothetical protein
MAAGTELEPDQIRARLMAQKAEQGDLVELDDYKLMENCGRYRITVDRSIPRNVDVEAGDEVGMYVDYDLGVAVLDFGGAIRNGGGDE